MSLLKLTTKVKINIALTSKFNAINWMKEMLVRLLMGYLVIKMRNTFS